MFKNKVYLTFLLIFFLSVLSLLIIVFSQNPCENCPETSCLIACNTTLIDSTSTWKYYNYTLNLDPLETTDVVIKYEWISGESPFQAYNLFGNETEGECPTSTSYDEAGFSGGGGNAIISFRDLTEGTYHFLINCSNACGNYRLNLTCAEFCGNGLREEFEECDATALECSTPYERCVDCECFDFRWTESVGCNYYDYCEDGMDPDDVEQYNLGNIQFWEIDPCCNDTVGPAKCCSLGGVPEKNCSVTGAVRNLSVTTHPDYCYNLGYIDEDEAWDRCVDQYKHPNGVLSYC